VHTGHVRSPRPSRIVGRRHRTAVALATLVVLVGACSDDLPSATPGGNGTEPPDPAVVADSELPDPAVDYDSNGEPSATEPAFVQVDANTATTAQLQATFEANGITNAATLAAEVVDHRPYRSADDAGAEFDELRAWLADAGLDAFTIEAVVASLTA